MTIQTNNISFQFDEENNNNNNHQPTKRNKQKFLQSHKKYIIGIIHYMYCGVRLGTDLKSNRNERKKNTK